MAFIKTLKFLNGISTEIDSANDSIVAKSVKIGGVSGTELVKADVDNLIGGSGDASALHNHHATYFQKSEFIASTTGAPDASKPLKSNASGRLDSSLLNYASFASHSNLSNLSSDDHTQYHNDTRGDARYFQKSEFIASSLGASDAGKPVKTNASGLVDSSFISLSGLAHNTLGSLQGGTASEYYHLTSAQHTAMTGGSGSDASAYHNHNTQYYTKAQIDTSLSGKADTTAVMLLSGTQAMAANMSLGGFRITNLAAPSGASDAARKQDVDDLAALTFKKDGSVAATDNFDLNNNKITNLATPIAGTDAANKNYVDNKMTNVSWRIPVRTLNTTSTSFPTGTGYTFDGVTHANGDRVLFTGLSNSLDDDRVYVLSGVGSSIVWTLATDGQAGTGAPTDGDAVYVREGTDNGDSQWNYNGTNFVQFSGAGQVQAGVGLTKTGNTLDVNLGAGIVELPSDEVGIDVHASGGLFTTVDNAASSTATGAQLAIKLNGATLDKSSLGLKVADGGIGATQLGSAAVETAKIADDAVDASKLKDDVSVDANRAVTTNHIRDAAITTAKIAADAVDKTKIAADIAGSGLSQAVGGELDVNVDGSTLEVNADTLRIKDAGVTGAKVAADAINDTHIDWGTGANQVSATDMPIADSANKLAAADVEAALAEIANDTMVRAETSGEAFSVNDLLVLRRDSSNNLRVFKANASSASNQVYASLVMQDLTYTSKQYSGNDTRIRYVDPGAPSQALSISVSGSDITVNLATDAGSAITSTASEIKTAIEANGSANALVSIVISGTGANIQAAQAFTNLAGGIGYNDNGRWEVYGMALDTAAGVGNSVRVRVLGRLACSFVSAPAASDIGKSVYLSINSGSATLTPPSSTGDSIVYLGRLVSATQVEFKQAILRGVLS